MPSGIPPDLWFKLLRHLQAHPTCEVTLYFHLGTARKMRLGEVVKAQEFVSDIPPSALDAARQDLESR